MPEAPSRFASLFARLRLLRILVALLAVGVAVGGGLHARATETGWVAAIAIGAAVALVAVGEALISIAMLLIKVESNTFRVHDLLIDVRSDAEKQTRLLEAVANHTRLSEVARGIAYREQERDIIRQAINERLIGGDFEAAGFLVDQLEHRHGYKQEATRLRAEIEVAREAAHGDRVSASVDRVERMLAAHQWDLCRVEIERLLKLFPSAEAIQRLPELLRERRDDHKRRLLKEWDESVQRNEIDRGIEILKELDQYLTPNEAAALEESARGVFRAKLHNMGVQFSLAVHDKQWADALEIGQQIIAEFPNSRMAAEVREHLAALRTRAARSVGAAADV